ncbi:MAG: type IX secretion system membrane protein PorP/SprF, partial [Bacteroidia bacterium]|nr:type IX secretion system membrane protein PorP/SprF [Bacteroidia bacterium]
MVKKVAIIICLFEFISSGVKAQDPTFSQFNFNPLYFNPAFTGIDPGLRINSTYRSLWSSIPSSFRTYSIAAD